MEKCPNCGNKLNSIDVLCPKCGTVVEVIQIKSSISASPEAAADTALSADTAMKKEFTENFIVYNEDFPADDAAVEQKKAGSDSIESALSETFAQEGLSVPYFDEGLYQTSSESGYDIAAAAQAPAAFEDETTGHPFQTGDEADEAYDYSERYLENLKNINLPEIDDLQSFDPDEFMREYKRGKPQTEDASLDGQSSADKKWLEIEEALESEEPAAPPQSSESTEAAPARRYRAAERGAKSRSKKRESAERGGDTPSKRSKPKKFNVAVTVLLWLVVSAALLCGFIFFDKYVQKAYGSYDSFIYTITDGKIDVVPGN